MLPGVRIGLWVQADELDTLIRQAAKAKAAGFQSVWAGQTFGLDTLTAFAVAGREVPGLAWGTAVVPTYPRHPAVLAMQALTTNTAVGGTLTLGIGPSHKIVIESIFGLDYSRPASHTEEYLRALVPLLDAGSASFAGEQVRAQLGLTARQGLGVPVLLSALAPRMLRLAGSLAAGTVTWMTGPKTVESHIAPSVRAAAEAAGRPEPRVVMALPVAVTDDEAAARAKGAELFAVYGGLPAYRAVLDREGAAGPAEVILAGDERMVLDVVRSLPERGVTEFVAVPFAEQERTIEALATLL
jgi:F420-dependent oxidoreductase-like protein